MWLVNEWMNDNQSWICMLLLFQNSMDYIFTPSFLLLRPFRCTWCIRRRQRRQQRWWRERRRLWTFCKINFWRQIRFNHKGIGREKRVRGGLDWGIAKQERTMVQWNIVVVTYRWDEKMWDGLRMRRKAFLRVLRVLRTSFIADAFDWPRAPLMTWEDNVTYEPLVVIRQKRGLCQSFWVYRSSFGGNSARNSGNNKQ